MNTPAPISKNAQRKARRYGPPPPSYAMGERSAFDELAYGSGTLSIGGFGVVQSRDTLAGRKRRAKAEGRPWRCGVFTK